MSFNLNKLIAKRYRSKLRLISRGYRQLKKEDNLEFPSKLRYILSRTKIENIYFDGLFQRGSFDIELPVRQFFTTRFLDTSFNRSILYSIGTSTPLKHPLPKEWRSALINQGVSVDNLSCAVLWHMYSFLFWGYSILQGLKSIYFLLKKQSSLGLYTYFDGLVGNNISVNPDSYNIINWYLQWENKDAEIKNICHSVSDLPNFELGKVNVVKTDGLPQLKGLKLFKYLVFIVYASIYGFVCLLFKPIYGLMLWELIKLKRVELANDFDLAEDYLFHNSMPFYRPIWTYIAEEKGSRILFYFYSTNNRNLKTKSGYPQQTPWHLISWPYYLVWDEFQADYIKSFDRYNSIVQEVGPIWFSSSEETIDVPLNSVAVFDVTPVRSAIYITLGARLEYYIYSTSNQFLSDIQLVLKNEDINMLHKMKRNHAIMDKKYVQKINQLIKKSNFIKVPPEIDALQLIKKTKACISMPFTSTALIAKSEGKPSVYYDPSGIIQKDEKAAHGIPILSNIDDLKEWVRSISDERFDK